jgi:DNA-binding FadR family transcriptional regulator
VTTPVRRQNLTYSIANNVGLAIVTGVYVANEPIAIEAVLRRQFGASRSVVREAVKMLAAKGLLESRPRLGTWVQPEENWSLLDPDVLGWLLERTFSVTLLNEFTQLRLAVEPAAAALAAQVAGREEKVAIRSAIECMQAAERDDYDPLDPDIAFHAAVLRASGNRFYAQLAGFTASALRFSGRMTNGHKGIDLPSIADRKTVADAIIAGRAAAAADAMRKIIQEALDFISKSGALRVTRRASET